MKVDLKRFTPAALQCLMGYAWPGNNRQLENEVKRLIAFVLGKSIKEADLDAQILSLDTPAPAGQESKEPSPVPSLTPTLPEAIDSLERRMIGRFTKIRWQQTKSGPGLRPEPPGVD